MNIKILIGLLCVNLFAYSQSLDSKKKIMELYYGTGGAGPYWALSGSSTVTNPDIIGNPNFTGKITITANSNGEPMQSGIGTISDANGTGNAHFSQSLVTINRTGNIAWGSYDSREIFTGAANTFDHHSAFQAIPTYDGVSITNHYGLYDRPIVNIGGVITNRYGIHVLPHTGAGTVTNDYGIYIGQLLGTNKYSIYSLGGPAYFQQSTNSDLTLLTLSRTGFTNGTYTGIDFTTSTLYPAQIRARSNSATDGSLEVWTNSTGTSSTSLTATFEADGDFRLDRGLISAGTDGSNTTPAYAFKGDLNMGMYRTGNTLAFGTASTQRLQIDNSGNVSIGNIAPTARLQLHNSTAATEVAQQFTNGTTGTGTTNGFFLGVSTDANAMVWYKNGAAIKFATNNSEKVRITSVGSVLIGTTTEAASSILTMSSTTKGFLPPRMTATEASAISSPAEGLMVYVTNTNGTFTAKGWWGYDGATWQKLNN